MRTYTKIEDISKDDLINLFSTATYGSSYLGAGYSYTSDLEDCETLEEAIAESLLKGRKIRVTDFYAEGSSFGNLEKETDDEENVTYYVALEDVKTGLERAINGTFNTSAGEFREDELRFARESFVSFANESADFDLTCADCLMQIILFNEIIYG